MRLHGSRVPEVAPVENGTGGGMCVTGADNEVWSFGEEACGILETLLKLRERMKPYISRLMREAHEVGRPVIRTLFYEFPADLKTWTVEDQYMFGDALLIAPVLEAGQRARNVYLPQGCDWIDARTGAEYAGGQTVTADAPIETIPVFVRKGAQLGFQWEW